MKSKIWNFSDWIQETDPQKIRAFFTNLLRKVGFTCVSFSEHTFEPQGYTALWLLKESHFALHTFPEDGRTYIEISSCNLDYFKTFVDEIKHL